EMVASGIGIALIEEDLVIRHIEEGRVISSPGLALEHSEAHYAVIPRQKTPRPETLLFAAWLDETFNR
ncbi:MAG: LysR substrate-binding domain-containing protein, partial [Pseudomonadota bacterium]